MKIIQAVFITVVGLYFCGHGGQFVWAQEGEQSDGSVSQAEYFGRKFHEAVKSKKDDLIVKAADEIFDQQTQQMFSPSFSGYFFRNSAYAYWRENQNVKAMHSAEGLIRHAEDVHRAIGYRLKFYIARDNATNNAKTNKDNSENNEVAYQGLKGFLATIYGPDASDDAQTIVIPQRYIASFLRDLKDEDQLKSENQLEIGDLTFKALKTLFESGYTPESPFVTMDFWAKQYGLGLLERGQLKQAEKIAGIITSPNIIKSMYIDKTYQPLWKTDRLKSADRVMKTFEKNISRLEKLVKKHPDKLQGRQSLIKAYARMGKLDEAVKLAKNTLLDMESFDSFSDGAEYKNWVFNEIAYVYYEIGDYERGNAYMLRAASISEDGSKGNISQVINYTAKLLDQAEYQKALDIQNTLLSEDGASDYGNMWIWYNQACGFYKLGQKELSAAAMKKLEEKQEKNYSAYTMSLLCQNKIEAAAQSYLVRLNAPEHRSLALEALQITIVPEYEMPLDEILRRNLEKIRMRPDILQAVNKYGRIETWPLSNTYWGKY